jgi:hypothetical protein
MAKDTARRPRLELGQEVRIATTGRPAVIKACAREHGCAWRYCVRYHTDLGAICDIWFGVDDLVTGIPSHPEVAPAIGDPL